MANFKDEVDYFSRSNPLNVWVNGYLDERQYRTNEGNEINLFPN